MKDPVLQRRLFKKAAQKKQVKENKVPGFFIGGLMNIGRAGMMGYRAFRGAQAARAAAGTPRNIARITQPVGRAFDVVGRKSTQLARANPKTAATLGYTDAALVGAPGAVDVYEGVKEGDIGQTMQGIGGIGLGAFGLGKGRKFMTKASLAKGAQPTKQQLRNVAGMSRSGEKLALPATGLYFAGSLTARPDQPISTTPVQTEIKKEEQNILKQGDDPTLDSGDSLSGSVPPDMPKTKLPIEDDGKTTGTLIEKQDRKQKAAKKMASDLSTGRSKEAREFTKFYNQINELTGGADDTKDLIMLKFAQGLLTGKTSQKGVSGLLDVAGQASGPAIDTAIALGAKEKQNKKDLAVAYLKAKKDTKTTSAVGKERFYNIIQDPNALGGQKVVEIARFKEGALGGYDAVFDRQRGGYVPMAPQPGMSPIKFDAGAQNDLRYEMDALSASYKMANTVKSMEKSLIGAPGAVKKLKEDVLGSLGAVLASEFTPSNYNGDTTGFVKDSVLKEIENSKGQLNYDEAVKKYDERVQRRVKDFSGLFGRPTDEELKKITQAAAIEVNLAYAYANALKGKDRLTEKNIDDAMKVTQIFGMKSPREVKLRMDQIINRSNEAFDKKLRAFQQAGGNNDFLELNYPDMPIVRAYKKVTQTNAQKQAAAANRNKLIESIKLN